MTNQEWVELIKKVAEVAPEELGAELMPAVEEDEIDIQVVFGRFHDGGSNPELIVDDELWSASAVFVMLDAMEKAGCSTTLRFWEDITDDKYELQIYPAGCKTHCTCCGAVKWNDFTVSGNTRAEVVAKAFVRVFGEKNNDA